MLYACCNRFPKRGTSPFAFHPSGRRPRRAFFAQRLKMVRGESSCRVQMAARRCQARNESHPKTKMGDKRWSGLETSLERRGRRSAAHRRAGGGAGAEATAMQTLKRHAADKKQKPHLLVLQVNTNEPAMMNLALNNATNVAQYYKDLGEKVTIEVVTFGPACISARDTSPVRRGSRRSRKARQQLLKPAAILRKNAQGRKPRDPPCPRRRGEVWCCACDGAAEQGWS